MFIKFEPSGTHVHKDQLKIRLDLYPEEGEKSYNQNYVYVPDETSKEFQDGYPGKVDEEGNPLDQKDYDLWIEGVPHVWQLNPCLSHFVTVPPDITKEDLEAWVKSIFEADATATIDNCMVQENSAHLISPYMKTKSKMATVKMWDDTAKMSPVLSEMATKGILTTVEASSVTTAKANPEVKAKVDTYITIKVGNRLADFSVGGQAGGTVEEIKPKSIDVGPGATDRAAFYGTIGTTSIDKNNPANTAGSLDTMEFYFLASYNGTSVKCGTFSGSSSTYDDRDYESIGTVTGGSKQTFTGLSCSVESGDYLGLYFGGGRIERDTSGYADYYYAYGDKFGGGSAFYTRVADDALSLYATGTESGGGWANIGKINGVTATDIAKVNGIAVADIGKINGVAV